MQKNYLESKVIGMMLSNPSLVAVTKINPKWFSNINDQKLYLSINNDTDGSIEQWHTYGRAHYKKTFHMATSVMYNLQEDAQRYLSHIKADKIEKIFDKNVHNLHRKYIINSISHISNRIKYDGLSSVLRRRLVNLLMASSNLDESDSGIDQTKAGVKGFEQIALHPDNMGMRTGFQELDYILGGLDDDMLLDVSAPTGTGKTAFCLNVCDNIARSHKNIRIDYFSAEMGATQIIERLISHRTGISDFNLNEAFNRLGRPRNVYVAKMAKRIANENKIHIYNTSNLDDILNTIRVNSAQRRPGTYLAVVDHVNIIQVPGATDKPENVQIGMITRSLKELTTSLHVPIIIQSQLNRASQYKDTNELSLQDLKGSSSIEQDSNVVLLLYKSNKQHNDGIHKTYRKLTHTQSTDMVINVAKNRNGKVEKIPFKFIGARMLFVENFKNDKHDDNADKVIAQLPSQDKNTNEKAQKVYDEFSKKQHEAHIRKQQAKKARDKKLTDDFHAYVSSIYGKKVLSTKTWDEYDTITGRVLKAQKWYAKHNYKGYDFKKTLAEAPNDDCKIYTKILNKLKNSFIKSYNHKIALENKRTIELPKLCNNLNHEFATSIQKIISKDCKYNDSRTKNKTKSSKRSIIVSGKSSKSSSTKPNSNNPDNVSDAEMNKIIKSLF